MYTIHIQYKICKTFITYQNDYLHIVNETHAYSKTKQTTTGQFGQLERWIFTIQVNLKKQKEFYIKYKGTSCQYLLMYIIIQIMQLLRATLLF